LTRAAARDLSIPELPGHIRNLLDDLRKYRNDIVHQGAPDIKKRRELDYRLSLDFLVAASFGVEYARFLARAVSDALPNPG
jgi:hypothetical protein